MPNTPASINADMARKVAVHIVAGNIDADALAILTAAVKAAETAAVTDGLPIVRLKTAGIRPQYLASCPGRLGKQRGSKVEFFPEPGTRAHDRSQGRAWKVFLTSLDDASQTVAREQGLY